MPEKIQVPFFSGGRDSMKILKSPGKRSLLYS